MIWDYWAEESTYHIAISLSLGSHYCQKGAASTGCAETTTYLFQLKESSMRPNFQVRKVQFSGFFSNLNPHKGLKNLNLGKSVFISKLRVVLVKGTTHSNCIHFEYGIIP